MKQVTRPVLYFIPGTMCDQLLWSHIWPELEDDFQLIHLPIPDKDNIEEICQLLVSQIPEDNFNLIGFSLGGYLASYLSYMFPNQVNKLMVIANTPKSLPEEELQQRSNTLSWLSKFAYRGMTYNKATQLVSRSSAKFDEHFSLMQKMEFNLGLEQLQRQLQATTTRIDLLPSFQSSNIKSHFVFGDDDNLVDRQWLQQLESCSHITQTEVSMCGHMLPLEKPQQLIVEIKTFF